MPNKGMMPSALLTHAGASRAAPARLGPTRHRAHLRAQRPHDATALPLLYKPIAIKKVNVAILITRALGVLESPAAGPGARCFSSSVCEELEGGWAPPASRRPVLAGWLVRASRRGK